MSRSKAVAEAVLLGCGLARAMRWRHRAEGLVLAYHNVLPRGERPLGDRSLHLPVESFVEQLDRLACTHEIVPLEELVGGTTPSRGRPRAAITFDDAYRGALEVALPELTRRGHPATIFVAPGLLGDRSFWWDRLADPDTGAVPDRVREAALGPHRGVQETVLGQFGPGEEMPSHSRSVTEAELLEIAASHDVTIGSHSWGHPNLARLPPEELRAELDSARRWVLDRFSRGVDWIAYPYGLGSAAVEEGTARVYGVGFALGGGYWPVAGADRLRYRVPRVNVPGGVTLPGFELRTSAVVKR